MTSRPAGRLPSSPLPSCTQGAVPDGRLVMDGFARWVLPSIEPNQGFEDRIKVLVAPLTGLRTKLVGETAARKWSRSSTAARPRASRK